MPGAWWHRGVMMACRWGTVTFTNYEFHNIGVPVNEPLRVANGSPPGRIDPDLAGNPAVADDAAQRGKFKTPTLRNVAVTGPYMHNGGFGDLRTVMLFYNKHNSKAVRRQMNPETGAAWAPPEAGDNLAGVRARPQGPRSRCAGGLPEHPDGQALQAPAVGLISRPAGSVPQI